MANDDVNQLAATLKAAGLCSSLYDAKNMAESISNTAKERHEEVEAKIVKYMGTGKRDEGFEVIKEKVTPETHKPNSFVAQKMAESDKEVFVNKDSLGVEVGKTESVAKMMEEEGPDEPGPEPEEPEPDEPEPEPEKPEQKQSSLSIFEESKEQPDIVVEEASQEQEVKAEVEPQQQEPGPKVEVKEIVQDKTQEIPVDKDKPKAQLTKEQIESTDLTKWFYFGNK